MTAAKDSALDECSRENLRVSEEEPIVYYRTQFVGLAGEPGETKCLICDLKFLLPTNEEAFLSHLFESHRLVIGDVDKIASLRSYANYWGTRLKDQAIATFCTTILMDCTPDGKPSKNEVYYLLSDCITEDKTLRDELHRARLELVLFQQAQERTDTSFERGCIFCRMELSGSRRNYLKHLSEKHNVYLGKAENLVFVDELLDRIRTRVESFTCIYCERIFKDRNVLKEHMRKKLHKRVNPNNKTYDKYYVTNYLEPGRNDRRQRQQQQQQQVIGESDERRSSAVATPGSDSEDPEHSWSDWDGEPVLVTCLLCPTAHHDFSIVIRHMQDEHNFDFEASTRDLNFYEKVKVVNYVRRQVYEKKCIYCDHLADNYSRHMRENQHEKLPPSRVWNQPEYYFPIDETDSFLYNLESNSSDEDDADDATIQRLSEKMAII